MGKVIRLKDIKANEILTELELKATEAKQDIAIALLPTSLGQKTMANSFAVVLSSNHSPIPVTVNQQTTTPPSAGNASSYSYDGKAFSFSGSIALASAGTDNNVLWIKNPTGSGKLVYLQKITTGTATANVSINMKLFASPTVTENGTLQTLTNNRIGHVGTASTLIYQAPTTSAKGTQIRTGTQGQNSNHIIVSDDNIIILQENQAVLLTGDPLSNNRTIFFTVTLIEV